MGKAVHITLLDKTLNQIKEEMILDVKWKKDLSWLSHEDHLSNGLFTSIGILFYRLVGAFLIWFKRQLYDTQLCSKHATECWHLVQ